MARPHQTESHGPASTTGADPKERPAILARRGRTAVRPGAGEEWVGSIGPHLRQVHLPCWLGRHEPRGMRRSATRALLEAENVVEDRVMGAVHRWRGVVMHAAEQVHAAGRY